MKKVLILIIIIVTGWTYVHSQNVGINDDGSDPDAAAMLDVKSTNKGILIPRIDYNNKPATPPTGLLIFVTANGPDGDNAFYFYNGSSWEKVAGGAGSDSDWTVSGNDMYSAVSGNVGIGTTAPDKQLEINSANGNNLRLTYNDANGSAANYADFLVSNTGNLSLSPSSGTTKVLGGVAATASNAGTLVVNGGVAANGGLNIARTITDIGASNASGSIINSTFTANSTSSDGFEDGLVFQSIANGSYSHNYLRSFVAAGYNNSSGTMNSLSGLTFSGGNLSTGGITNLTLANFAVYSPGSGTITNANGVSIGNMNLYGTPTTSKSINLTTNTTAGGTSKYHIYAGDISGAINNYFIYSLGGKNYFAGNIGIGKTDPTYNLDVSGNINFTGTLYQNGSPLSVTGLWSAVTGGINYGSGNVGIGTTSPSALLDVNGTVRLRNGAQEGYILTSDANGNATWQAQISGDPMPSGWTVSGNNVYKNVSGYVGIGTTSPEANLSFQPTDYTTEVSGIKFQNSENESDAIFQPYKNPAGDINLIIGANVYGSTSGSFERFNSANESAYINVRASDGAIHFGTGGNSSNPGRRMVIDSTGKVGIGTTTPAYSLEVSNTGSAAEIEVTRTDGAQGLFKATGDYVMVGSRTNFPLSFMVNNSEKMVLGADGKLGLGVSSPGYALHIEKTIDSGSQANLPWIQLSNKSTGGTFSFAGLGFEVDNDALNFEMFADGTGFFNSGSPNFYFRLTEAYPIIFGTANTKRMIIGGDGKVGIGTTTPAYNFDVTGDINLTGTLYQNGSPLSVTGLWSAVTGGINYGSGNVGIGTTTPSRKLSIDGTLSQLGISSSGVERFVASISANIVDLNPLPDATGATAVRFFRTTNTTGTKRIDFLKGDGTATTQARIGVDGQNSFFQVGGGNLGIGTMAPESTLDVEGTVSFKQGSMTESSDAFDVSGATSFTVNSTAGNIVLGGLSGGVQGQIIYLAKITSTNSLTIEHNESTGTQKIICPAGVDLVLSNYGGVTLLYNGSLWYVVSMAQ